MGGMKTQLIALITLFAALALHGAGSVVRIEGSTGAWHLTLNGKPYFIKGGGGGGSKAETRSAPGARTRRRRSWTKRRSTATP